jgi:hypothetical protein
MKTTEFLNAILSDEGQYCVVGIKKSDTPDKKPVIKHKFYQNIEAVSEAAENFDAEGYDAYYTPATFVEGTTNRVAKNVSQMKALFLDLDCGEGKAYSTQADALKHLREFRKHFNLPQCTAVVNSGRGLHVYWVLTRAYSREEWLPVAEKLKVACAEFGLDADSVVTADAARILRVPNTHNYKDDPALNVQVVNKELAEHVELDKFAASLPDAAIPVITKKTFSEQDREDIARAKGWDNYQSRFGKLLELSAQGKGCAQVNRAVMSPNELSYNDWIHILSVAGKCTVDGDKAIHLISQGYEGYDPQETEEKAASLLKPHYCATFEEDNPEGCKGCPHKGKIQSPMKLCMEMREAESDEVEVQVVEVKEVLAEGEGEDIDIPIPTESKTKVKIPDYPAPYKRAPDGAIFVTVENKDGSITDEIIYKRPLYITKRLRDPLAGPSFEFKHHTEREGIQTFNIPMTELTSKELFRKAMGMNDIFVLSRHADLLMTYIGAWIHKLQGPDGQDMVDVRTQFGWADNRKVFVVGNREVTADEIRICPASQRTLQYIPMFQKKGTLEGWKKVTSFYNRPDFEEHQMMFGLSFGSPLMEFVPNISGAIYHLMSTESGYGKTTGMMAGASVWGNHKKLVLRGKDTGNSAWNRGEIWKNLPLYIDEITNLEGKGASEFTYAVTDGEQRNRLSNSAQNEERYRGEDWAFICGTSGNTSLEEIVGKHRDHAKGELGRMIEAMATKKFFSYEDTMLANTLNDDLANNYGHAGEIYIQHVLQNMKSVEKLVLATRDKMIKKAELDSQHRFWVAEMSCTFAGLLIAKQIGLLEWDLEPLYKWMIQKLVIAKEKMQAMVVDIHDLIAQFLNDNPRGILRVKSTSDARIHDPEMENIILPDASPSWTWVGRLEYDINRLYIVPNALKNWCVKRGHVYASVKTLMEKFMGMQTTKMRLGKGTKLKTPMQHLLVVSWDEDDNDTVDGE